MTMKSSCPPNDPEALSQNNAAMTFKIWDDAVEPYFHVELWGPLNVRDLEDCYKQIFNHPNWKTGANILWDARGGTFDHINDYDLEAISDMTCRYKDQGGRGRVAWVVARTVDFGVSRMFEMMNDGKIIFHFEVFRTLAAAQEFLASRDESEQESHRVYF